MSDPPGSAREDAPDEPASGKPPTEERIAELESRVEELRQEVGPPRGPLGVPRPPTPGELLRFADEHALPTAIAVLEANVHALEALREAIRLLRRVEDRDPRRGTAELGDRADGLRDRTDTLAREAIEEFDRAVTDLAEAVEGGGLPDDEEARSVLEEARAVREEVAGALENGAAGPGTGGDDGATAEGGGTEIDVEGELESIREEVHGEDAGDGDATSGDSTTDDPDEE